MAMENNESKKVGATKEFFKWSYDETLALCDVIIQYIMKNGRGQSIKWREIEKEVTQRIKRQCATNCCKHTYDAMRKDWRAWKHLKTTETRLGWILFLEKLTLHMSGGIKKIKVSFFLTKIPLIVVYHSKIA